MNPRLLLPSIPDPNTLANFLNAGAAPTGRAAVTRSIAFRHEVRAKPRILGGIFYGLRGKRGGRVLSFQEKRKNQRKADWLFSRMCILIQTFLGSYIREATLAKGSI